MVQNEKSGLCQTCRYAPNCAFPTGPGAPVLQCEEFEAEGAPPVKKESRAVVSAAPGADAAPPMNGSGKYKGLCTNCEDRDSCTFPKAEKGVWHCEEYR